MRLESAVVRRRCAALSLRRFPSVFRTRPELGRALVVCITVAFAAAVAGCVQNSDMQVASSSSTEYFPESIYGPASARVVTNGPVPRGGGQYLVGRPYTIAGRLYVPREMSPSFTEVGMASWYGDAFHGRRTANGEIYDKNALSAAHPTMPLPSYARVTNLQNGHSVIVRVNDRGPYHAGRVMDVSSRVADLLDFKHYGMAKVRVDYIGPASLGGSDDSQLMASLRTDGEPAQWAASADTGIFARLAPALPLRGLITKARLVVSRAEPGRLRPESDDADAASGEAPKRVAVREPPSPPVGAAATPLDAAVPLPPRSRRIAHANPQAQELRLRASEASSPPQDAPLPPKRRRQTVFKAKPRPAEDDDD